MSLQKAVIIFFILILVILVGLFYSINKYKKLKFLLKLICIINIAILDFCIYFKKNFIVINEKIKDKTIEFIFIIEKLKSS